VRCGNAGCARTAYIVIFLRADVVRAYAACVGCDGYLSHRERPANIVCEGSMEIGGMDEEEIKLSLLVMEDCELVGWSPGLK